MGHSICRSRWMPPSCPSRRVQRARTSAGTLAAPKRLVPASPGVRVAPPPYHSNRVHSRFDSLRPKSQGNVPSGRRCHSSTPVPPSWCCTTATVSSAIRAASLLHLAAGHGVHRVSRLLVPDCPSLLGLRRGRLGSCAEHDRRPRDADTLRRIPLTFSRTASPRPLPSCRFPLGSGLHPTILRPPLVGPRARRARVPPRSNPAHLRRGSRWARAR
jgi:hypothetical protein